MMLLVQSQCCYQYNLSAATNALMYSSRFRRWQQMKPQLDQDLSNEQELEPLSIASAAAGDPATPTTRSLWLCDSAWLAPDLSILPHSYTKCSYRISFNSCLCCCVAVVTRMSMWGSCTTFAFRPVVRLVSLVSLAPSQGQDLFTCSFSDSPSLDCFSLAP